MLRQSHAFKLYFAIFVLGMVTLACSLPNINSQSQSAPSIQLPDKSVIDQSTQSAPTTGDLSINKDTKQFLYETDESTLTSKFSEVLNSRPEIGISNPVIFLRNGVVEIHAQYNQSGINLPLVVVINLFINTQSQIEYEITSAKIGPLPLPGALVEQFSTYFDTLISSNLGLDQSNVVFNTLVIENGILSVSGYYR